MSDLAKIEPEISAERGQVDEALVTLQGFTITDEAGMTWAGDLLLKAKARAKVLEAKRKEITAPILAAKAAIDGLFNPVIERYERAEAILKTKVADWTRAVEVQRRAVMQASAAEFNAGGTPTAIIPEPAKVEGISVRQVWEYEITDWNAVPREFCSPDPKKIRAQLPREGAQPPVIPGIRFFQRDQVAARTKG